MAFRYYYNHNTGECTWTPPRNGASFLHYPQDYVVALENEHVYYVKWSTSPEKPHVRTWTKPSGYLRCTSCLQNLALVRCVTASGAFCFRCFRDTFDDAIFMHHFNRQQRVEPISCGVCSLGKLAAWRCTEDESTSMHASLVACTRCFERMTSNRLWLRL